MLSFTLDTNCVIAVAEQRPEREAILRLADAHAMGTANVSIVAIMASERQRATREINTFTKFKTRLNDLGLGHLELSKPLAYFGITFWGFGLTSGPEHGALEKRIHQILFPDVEFRCQKYCRNQHGAVTSENEKQIKKWRNAKCDVLALWSHVHYRRQVFVTSDLNFHKASKKPHLIALGAGKIESPQTAVSLI